MRLCCIPGSGTAMAPSLLENHREIFTDGRGGKKILHLGVREGGGRKGGREGEEGGREEGRKGGRKGKRGEMNR